MRKETLENKQKTEHKNGFCSKINYWLLKNISLVIPFVILLLLLTVFTIASSGAFWSNTNFVLILKKTLPYIIAAMGCVFVTAMGGTDITQGSLVALLIAIIYKLGLSMSGGSIVVALFVGLGAGLFMGICNAIFHVNSFMLSLGLLVLFRALASMVGGTGTAYAIPEFMNFFGSFGFAIPFTIFMIVLTWFLFHKTPFGNYVRAIGENENAVKFSGVNIKKVKILAFCLSSFFTALAALVYYGFVGGGVTLAFNMTGMGFEMSILIAMFIGGIPVQGGYGSNIFMIILGAFTISVLENGLNTALHLNTYYVQLIKGILLIVILFVTYILKVYLSKKEIMKKSIANQ